MVHQHFKLIDVLSATENIILGLEGRLNIKEASRKIEEICDKYGFEVDPKQKIYDMTVSQKQTVEIVKVLYRGADILILDEVLSVGDAKFRKKSEKKVLSMFDKGVTVLFVSHSLEQVQRLCNKAMILEKGKLIAYGDIDPISEQYSKMIGG